MKAVSALRDAPRRAGRPTREEAARRDLRLLETASRLFLEQGYEGASMDAVADAAEIGKPTLYNLYKDKRALFEAVLTARINDWLLPLAQAAEGQESGADSGDLDEVLHRLSRAMLRHASTPGAAALHRVIVAQKAQFPELAQLAYQQGWVRAVEAVATVLREGAARKGLVISDEKLAADFFLNLIIGPSSRAALYGVEFDAADMERRRSAAVELFLQGLKAL